MRVEVCVLLICLNVCCCVIHELNDLEYGRMPPLFGLDEYDSCLLQPGGVYCMAHFNLHADDKHELYHMLKEYSLDTVKHYNYTYIQRGVCLRSTCKEFILDKNLYIKEDLEYVLEECVNKTLYNEFGINAKLGSVEYCDKHEDVHETDLSDWIVAGCIAILLMVNLVASVYDLMFNRNKKEDRHERCNQYLLSFSVFSNWKWLTSSLPADPRVKRLNIIHGIKATTTFLMVIAHANWVNSTGFTDNPHDFEKNYHNVLYQLLFNGMMIVQIFFVLSGFLLTYNILIRTEVQPLTWSMYPKILFLRWWRLTPSTAVMLAFTSTWLRYVGSGPLWRFRVVDSVSADCRRFWWAHLLYVNNYIADDKFCAIQTWHIAADTQVFAIGLAALVASGKGGRLFILGLLLLIGLVTPAFQVWLHDMDGVIIMTPEFFRAMAGDTFKLLHSPGHTNISCFVIGMLAAYLFYQLQMKGVDLSTNKIMYYLSWFIIPAILGLFLYGWRFYIDERPSLFFRMVYASLHRVLMSCITAFATIALISKCNNFICAILEWDGWLVPGRLSFSVYLLHINFIHALLGSWTKLGHVSLLNLLIVHSGVFLITTMVALPFYLLVEGPMTRFMKVLIDGQVKKVS